MQLEKHSESRDSCERTIVWRFRKEDNQVDYSLMGRGFKREIQKSEVEECKKEKIREKSAHNITFFSYSNSAGFWAEIIVFWRCSDV